MKEEDLSKLPSLRIPFSDLKIRKDENEELKIYDRLRKKEVFLTPEEFVRQQFVEWMISQYGYPAGMMQNEVTIDLNETKKRCDTIAFGRDGNPLIIFEYKAPSIEITQEVFDQIYKYNLALKAKYLVVSNGRNHYCCKLDYINNTYHFIPKIPTYYEALGLPIEN